MTVPPGVPRNVLRIATRGSELALWQTRAVADALRAADPTLAVRIEVLKTTGDRIQDVPLAKIGDKGLWTKELDGALLAGRADLAVHSLKDVPTGLPEGLVLAAVTAREDPRDVVLSRPGTNVPLAELPPGSRVGTSALRRAAQLHALHPDLKVVNLRGNLNTRLAKLDAGGYDAIVLAAAGVIRLGWEERITEFLEPPAWLPAAGQGALAVVVRADDSELRRRLRAVHDPSAGAAVAAERAFLAALQGGCQVPIAALATPRGSRLLLHGFVSDLQGAEVLRGFEEGEAADAAGIGVRLAASLRERGAHAVLQSARNMAGAVLTPAP